MNSHTDSGTMIHPMPQPLFWNTSFAALIVSWCMSSPEVNLRGPLGGHRLEQVLESAFSGAPGGFVGAATRTGSPGTGALGTSAPRAGTSWDARTTCYQSAALIAIKIPDLSP